MSARFLLVLLGLLAYSAAVHAQPWPAKETKAGAALDSLLGVGVNAAAIKKVTGSQAKPTRWEVADAAKLAALLKGNQAALTDSVCDEVVLRWRDDSVNRPFWTAYLRSMADATARSRVNGFADLFEGVAVSGDAQTADIAAKRFSRARDAFREAKDQAWAAAAETEIGNLALARDQFAAADDAYGRAVQLYTQSLGKNHPLVAGVVRNRGNVAYHQQKYAAAVKFYREATDILGSDDGPNARELADCLQNLANAHMATQNTAAAKDAIERGLAIVLKRDGAKSPRQLPFQEVLGTIYFSRGEAAKARDVAEQALTIARGAFGADSVATVRYLNTFADREKGLGRAKSALKLHCEARDLLEQQPLRNKTEIADILVAIAKDHEDLALPGEARKYYQQALEGYRKGTTRLDRVGVIFTLRDLSTLASRQGKTDESKTLSREAVNAATKELGAAHPFVSLLKQNQALQLLENGAFGDAIAEYRSARETVDKTTNAIRWAELTANLAMALEMAGEVGEAEREVNEAIAVFRRDQHPNLAGAYLTLAAIHRKRSDDEKSAHAHRLALDIQTKILGPESSGTLSVKAMVALDERNAGNLTQAESLYREIAEIRKRRYGADHPEYVKALRDIASLRAQSGHVSEAVASYEDILKLQKASTTFSLQDRVSVLREFAIILESKNQLDRAAECVCGAMKLLRESNLSESLDYADFLMRAGDLAESKGVAKTAEQYFAESLGVHRKLKSLSSDAALAAIKKLAQLRQNASDGPAALKWIEEGLAALAVDAPSDGPAWRADKQSADLLRLKAEMLVRSAGKSVETLKSAHQLLVTADDISDRLRYGERSSTTSKAALIGRVQSESTILHVVVCELLASVDPAGGWEAMAVRVAEQGRARVFLEQLGRTRSGIIGELPPALAASEHQTEQEVERLRLEIEAVQAMPFDRREPKRILALQKALADATLAREEVQATITRSHPRVASLRRPYPCSVDDARAVLAKNEAAVIFCCGESVGYAIVIQPVAAAGKGVSLIPLVGMREFAEEFEVLIDKGNLMVPDLYESAAAKLYRTLISPLEGIVGNRDLLIIPDGKLGLLPFEALIDSQGRFLIQSRTVRTAPSLTALHLNRLWDQKRARPARTLLAVGDPITSSADPRLKGQPLVSTARRVSERTGERFDRLVHSGREVVAVADVFRTPVGDRWTGAEASESHLKALNSDGWLAEYRYLHFATHGILGAGLDYPPALVLSFAASSAQGSDDGLLTVGEISNLRLNADLVVLSACNTARGELRTGEGITGLARSFLNAGTRTVVCSLWAVDDADTAEMMADLYRAIDGGSSAAAALRAAKLRLIRDRKHPYDWAPFIVMGSAN